MKAIGKYQAIENDYKNPEFKGIGRTFGFDTVEEFRAASSSWHRKGGHSSDFTLGTWAQILTLCTSGGSKMDYAKLRIYCAHKVTDAINDRANIATQYEKKEELHELTGKIEAYMDVWKYAEALEASEREVE